ncbi:MAG: sensor histidine kinase [Calditrichaeota bacterium]|nr:MAG: sensor histidine kinase [Calditrichota bacterium]MBL1204886.1 sensor histidine kinase [Calditrichota bacterium]NOG44715.1 HAMP domain-containing protein [Calditrichota bacterium]
MNSLSYKIGLGYFIIIILNISIAIFAVYHINQLSEPIDQILKENYRNIKSAEQMKEALTSQEMIQLTMVERGMDSSLVNNFRHHKTEFNNWHENAVNGISLPREPVILDSLKLLYSNYLQKSDSLQNFILCDMTYKESKSYHFIIILPLATEINLLCVQMKELNEQAIFNADNKARGISFQANALIGTFSVFAILFSIIAGIYFTQSIIRPVNKTTETVRKIRRGQFNQKIPITTNDEIAELGIEFNRMTDRLDKHIRDVSGLKKLDQMKSDFMSTISHEFKTPLTSINLTIDILLNQKAEQLSSQQKELLILAKEDCTRLTNFARELLELSKLESGTKPMHFEKINISDLIDFSMQPFKIMREQKSITINVKLNPVDIELKGDRNNLSRVISNMLDNAINHSKQGGRIDISASQENDNLRFSIADQGVGIPAQSIDLVFDKFIQVGSARKKGNIGLGLAICKEIISMHKGKIWVESELGKGSTFIFTIPFGL